MDAVLTIHSINRWLIVAIALINLVKFTIGWLGKKEYKPLNRGLMGAFAGLMDLQALLGIVLIVDRGFEGKSVEHATTMIIAIILTHLLMRRRSANDAARFRTNVIAIVGSLSLIIAGVLVLPQGWFG
jgi:hypothetical protein